MEDTENGKATNEGTAGKKTLREMQRDQVELLRTLSEKYKDSAYPNIVADLSRAMAELLKA